MNSTIVRLILCASVPLCLCVETAAHAAQYSKLGIITAAKSIGKWPALKAWIAQSGYEDEWQAAAYFSDTYPQFAAITNAVCAAGIASPEEVAAILSASVDKAPDALLVAVYEREIATESGRVKWHGRRTGYNEDTNTLVVVTTYADGWTYSEPFTKREPQSLDARMAAARAAKAKFRAATMPPGLAATEAARDESAAETNEVTVIVWR